MRNVIAAAIVIALSACGGGTPAPKPAEPAPPALHLSPIDDLVPAAGLSWLVVARPREIAQRADLIPAIHELVGEDRFDAFAAHNGGVDLRELDELAVARYAGSTLYLARGRIDPARVEAAFAAHLVNVDGRAIDRKGGGNGGGAGDRIVRTWGGAADGREQLAIFGTFAVGLEQGKLAPLRAAELFAEQRLKRAAPARRTALLARASSLAGDAPLLGFAPGPFDAEWSRGLGGLLAATTAIAIAIRFPPPAAADAASPAKAPALLTLVLLGGWGTDAPAAADRLLSVWNTMGATALGRLCAVDRPLAAARARTEPDALVLEVTLDTLAATRGLHAAIDAQVDEMMRYGAPHATAPLTPVPKQ